MVLSVQSLVVFRLLLLLLPAQAGLGPFMTTDPPTASPQGVDSNTIGAIAGVALCISLTAWVLIWLFIHCQRGTTADSSSSPSARIPNPVHVHQDDIAMNPNLRPDVRIQPLAPPHLPPPLYGDIGAHTIFTPPELQNDPPSMRPPAYQFAASQTPTRTAVRNPPPVYQTPNSGANTAVV
ncbi:hypothetical protein BU17DRAFT_70088 [Hysterangium stoloniferum]|nr:hypothetical protein BU17DRAFT_70088 [Hysterangium stoloniferum]